MMRLDPNDPLDRLALKEARGEPVLFDEWEETMDALADEPDCEQLLQMRGLGWEQALQESQAYRSRFYQRLRAHDLLAEDRFALCRSFSEQAQTSPSEELLELYCDILCDPGFLLDHGEVPGDAGDQRDIEGQTIQQYIHFKSERDTILRLLVQRGKWARQLAAAKKEKSSPHFADCSSERCNEVFQCFVNEYDVAGKDGATLLGNLSAYMGVIERSTAWMPLEPLILFLLLTRHQGDMCHRPYLSVDWPKLWKRTDTAIEGSGRSARINRKKLKLFSGLCRIFEQDGQVEIPMCWYGLDQITSLGEFYRADEAGDGELPFPPTIEELVEDSLFTCFEHGYGDNVLLQDSGFRCERLFDFECSAKPRIAHALELLSDYMNSHADTLMQRFLGADKMEIRTICGDILSDAELPTRYQTRDVEELSLFLAAVNEGLMELKDYFAARYLIRAGEALTSLQV